MLEGHLEDMLEEVEKTPLMNFQPNAERFIRVVVPPDLATESGLGIRGLWGFCKPRPS